MEYFSFGKKKKTKSCKQPPVALLNLAKKYRVKTKVKYNNRLVYKHTSVIKRQIKKRISALKKSSRSSNFGFAPFKSNPKSYGYHQKIRSFPGALSQTSSVVTLKNNINRPPGTGLNSKYIPTYGTYARFFTEKVPRVVGPRSIGFMGQPDGSLYAVGSPFYRYTRSNSFGGDLDFGLRGFRSVAGAARGASTLKKGASLASAAKGGASLSGAKSKVSQARKTAQTASMIFKARQMFNKLFKK